MRRIAAGAAALLLAAAVLAGCSTPPASIGLSLEERESSARLEVGDIVDLRHLDYSSSIGDDWEVVSEPDPEVLRFVDRMWDGDQSAAGGSGDLTLRYEAVGPGTTEIVLQYSFQGAVPEGPEGEPLTVTVTVS